MIDEVDRRLIQLEMEKLSLGKETRADALKRIEQIDDEMAELQEKQVGVQFHGSKLLHLFVDGAFNQCAASWAPRYTVLTYHSAISAVGCACCCADVGRPQFLSDSPTLILMDAGRSYECLGLGTRSRW